MYTCYQVVLIAEDGEYPQADFQTEQAAFEYIKASIEMAGEGRNYQIKPIRRGF